MIDLPVAYDETRLRISRICEQVDESRPVPACPGWSVYDLVAHLVGLADDVIGGNIDGYGTHGWTAAQVAQRSGRSTGVLVGEWAKLTPRLVAALDQLPATLPPAILVDVVTHEHDLRGALSLPGHRESDSVRLATRLLVGGLREQHEWAGLPPIVLVALGEREYPVGRGEPVGSVRASLFALFRSLSGRRTRSQVAGFDWSVDPEPYLDHWLQFPFSWPSVGLRDG